MANGFNTFRFDMMVVGRNGETLKEHWQKYGGMEAFKTTAMAGFPNLFFLSGPNSVSGHNSSLYSIEWWVQVHAPSDAFINRVSAVDLTIKVVTPVLEGKMKQVEVRRESEHKWVKDVQEALRLRVYADQCDTVRK